MAHIEMQLLSRIIRTGCLAEVVEWGITQDDFRTTEGRGLFINLLGYWKSPGTAGSVPGGNAVKWNYPTFEFCDDQSMEVRALCTEVRRHRMTSEAKEFIQEFNETVDVDPMQAISRINLRFASLQTLGMQTNDSFLSTAIDEMWQRYQNTKNGIGVSSLFWPWEALNAQTLGIQDDDYIVLYGRPKSMKSFVLSAMAACCYDQGKNVLVYTKEMPAWQLFRRVGGFVAKLPYNELRLGKMSDEDEHKFRELYTMVKQQAYQSAGRHNMVCISGRGAPAGQDSMSWVRGKIEKYKPDIVFIDGLYLMSADGKPGKDHERVASISRAGRQMVLETHIPLVATMQANRSAAKHQNAELDEIAFSDAIGQDATAAIRVINDKVEDRPTISLVFAGSREFKMNGIRINARPCTDFSFIDELSDRDVAKAKERDTDEHDAKNAVIRRPITNGTNGAANQIPSTIQASVTDRMAKQGL